MAINRGLNIERKFLSEASREKFEKAKRKTLGDASNPNSAMLSQLVEQEALINAQRGLFQQGFDASLSDVRRQIISAQRANRERQAITGIYDDFAQLRDNALLTDEVDYQLSGLLSTSMGNALNYAVQSQANQRSQLQASYQALVQNEVEGMVESGTAQIDHTKQFMKFVSGAIAGAMTALPVGWVGGQVFDLFASKIPLLLNKNRRARAANKFFNEANRLGYEWNAKLADKDFVNSFKNNPQGLVDAAGDYKKAILEQIAKGDDAASLWDAKVNKYQNRLDNRMKMFKKSNLFKEVKYTGELAQEASERLAKSFRISEFDTLGEFDKVAMKMANAQQHGKMMKTASIVDDLKFKVNAENVKANKVTKLSRFADGSVPKKTAKQLLTGRGWGPWLMLAAAIIGGTIGVTKSTSYYMTKGQMEALKSNAIWQELSDMGGWNIDDVTKSMSDYMSSYEKKNW